MVDFFFSVVCRFCDVVECIVEFGCIFVGGDIIELYVGGILCCS